MRTATSGSATSVIWSPNTEIVWPIQSLRKLSRRTRRRLKPAIWLPVLGAEVGDAEAGTRLRWSDTARPSTASSCPRPRNPIHEEDHRLGVRWTLIRRSAIAQEYLQHPLAELPQFAPGEFQSSVRHDHRIRPIAKPLVVGEIGAKDLLVAVERYSGQLGGHQPKLSRTRPARCPTVVASDALPPSFAPAPPIRYLLHEPVAFKLAEVVARESSALSESTGEAGRSGRTTIGELGRHPCAKRVGQGTQHPWIREVLTGPLPRPCARHLGNKGILAKRSLQAPRQSDPFMQEPRSNGRYRRSLALRMSYRETRGQGQRAGGWEGFDFHTPEVANRAGPTASALTRHDLVDGS